MWAYVIGEATIFGVTVALSSFLNGRATRRMLREDIRETRERLGSISEKHGKILEKLSDQHMEMINLMRSTRGKKSSKRS